MIRSLTIVSLLAALLLGCRTAATRSTTLDVLVDRVTIVGDQPPVLDAAGVACVGRMIAKYRAEHPEYRFLANGCVERAWRLNTLIRQECRVQVAQVSASGGFMPSGDVFWSEHYALAFASESSGGREGALIADPALSDAPMPIREWIRRCMAGGAESRMDFAQVSRDVEEAAGSALASIEGWGGLWGALIGATEACRDSTDDQCYASARGRCESDAERLVSLRVRPMTGFDVADAVGERCSTAHVDLVRRGVVLTRGDDPTFVGCAAARSGACGAPAVGLSADACPAGRGLSPSWCAGCRSLACRFGTGRM